METNPKAVRGEYTVTHLRPKEEFIPQFMPLWDARNRHMEKVSRLQEIPHLFGLGKRIREKLISREDREITRLSSEMLPLQTQIGETEVFSNLITTVGKNDILDKYLKGSAYTQTIRMGLKGTGSAVIGDTQASHSGWLEQGGTNQPTYTGNRKDVTMGAASGGVSTSPTQAFAITGTSTAVFGCFINNGGSATKDDTAGILFSAGDFSGGSKTVQNLDTLNVTYTLTAA